MVRPMNRLRNHPTTQPGGDPARIQVFPHRRSARPHSHAMKHPQSLLFLSLTGLLVSATDVYLHPPASSALTNKPNLLLAQYLSLERFHSLQDSDLTENLDAYSQGLGSFVGKGLENVVVIGVGEEEVADVLPESLSQPLVVDTSATSLFSQYTEQAESVYTDVSRSPSLSSTRSSPSTEGVPRMLDAFTLSPSPESSAFLADLASLVKFSDEVAEYDTESSSYFGAFDLSRSLHMLTQKFGRDSEQYQQAVQIIRMIVEGSTKIPNLKTAVISVPKSEVTKKHITKRAHSKRQQSPLPPPLPHPAEPIGAVSTCYASLDSCTNSTSSCSGHGSCISASKAGRTCFRLRLRGLKDRDWQRKGH
ncbi:hypothetical protein QCA50_003858 [Cerrena zonata]|uniref:Vacuolar sorting protein Vps3844 C-terminal domain-containing protein n=1 Tax=Cerrena zonata TaxID=2478898 RepID=A0AAW0GFD2_9APHY